jgi:hypothetical protein
LVIPLVARRDPQVSKVILGCGGGKLVSGSIPRRERQLCVHNLPVNKSPCRAGRSPSFDSESVVLLAHAAFLTEGQAHDHPLARLADAKNTQDEN